MTRLAPLALAALILSAAASPLFAQPAILDPEHEIRKAAGDCKFTEGPALDSHGNLYFSDGRNNRIMRLTPEGELSEFRKPSGRANGLLIDGQDRLLMCQSSGNGGGRRVTRLEADGSETVLAAEYEGKPFIAPNDLTIDARGRIFFTDPWYGPPAEKSQSTAGVYRIDAPGKVKRVISNLERPNGILVTADGRSLLVSDRFTQKLHRYQFDEAGELVPDGVVYDFSPDRGIDGMWLDVDGNIYAAAGEGKTTGLFVVSPQGKLLLHKPMPEFSTNVVIGGKDGRDLYLTATTSVYHLRTVKPTAKLPPVRQSDSRR